MAKADDKVQYEDDGKMVDEKYSHFELLEKRVELLQEMIEELTGILRENNLVRVEKIQAPDFDENRLYHELEDEHKQPEANHES